MTVGEAMDLVERYIVKRGFEKYKSSYRKDEKVKMYDPATIDKRFIHLRDKY